MRILEQGWLTKRPELPNVVLGIPIPPETRTRKEEYTFVVEALNDVKGSELLDIATGYIPPWHRLAEIMVRAGWNVLGIDTNPGVMGLAWVPGVVYLQADGRAVPVEDHVFDVVTCISTLEHVGRGEAREIVAEMQRCVKPGGRLVLTADAAPWLPVLFGGACDPTPPLSDGLDPQVFYVIVEA